MLIHNRFTGCWQKTNSVHEGRCRQRCLPTRRKFPRRPLTPYVETSAPLRKTDWGRRSARLVFHVCFQEKQQKVKHWVKSASHPLDFLTNHVEVDILARLEVFDNLTADDVRAPWEPRLTVPVKGYVLADRERNDIVLMGATSFRQSKSFKVCEVLGVHLRSGEWGNHRCGSVITLKM